tara:strand:- start:1441 stop:2412 length:972 start_codon:yes stop_codon:yes gene_type:complete
MKKKYVSNRKTTIPKERKKRAIGRHVRSKKREFFGGRNIIMPGIAGGFVNPATKLAPRSIRFPNYNQRAKMIGGHTFLAGSVLAEGRKNAIANAIRFGNPLPISTYQAQQMLMDSRNFQFGLMSNNEARYRNYIRRMEDDRLHELRRQREGEIGVGVGVQTGTPVADVTTQTAEPIYADELDKFRIPEAALRSEGEETIRSIYDTALETGAEEKEGQTDDDRRFRKIKVSSDAHSPPYSPPDSEDLELAPTTERIQRGRPRGRRGDAFSRHRRSRKKAAEKRRQKGRKDREYESRLWEMTPAEKFRQGIPLRPDEEQKMIDYL